MKTAAQTICIGEWLKKSTAALVNTSTSPDTDAEYLLAVVLGKARSYFFTWPDKPLNGKQLSAANALLARRIKGEPIAHILGERAFWSLDLYCDNSTLIPRSDTEILVENILTLPLPKAANILDLGTGTGAIALALASERRDFLVDAVDISESAVRLAIKNRERHKLSTVDIFISDWFSAVNKRYDCIVSNPPYIDKQDQHLQQGDLRFEPHSALVADDEGLADIKKIVRLGRGFLKPQGYLVLEHGWQQKHALHKLFQDAGFTDIKTWQDYGGNDRASLARYGGSTAHE